jgi:hypothetical protein
MSAKLLGFLIALVIVASCAVSAAESSESSFEAFKKTMSVTAGPNALACGEVSLEANAAEAFKCARTAIDTNATFWVVVQKQGVDSQPWVESPRIH